MNRSFEKKGIPHHPPRVVNKCPDCNKNSLIIDKYARLTKLLTIKVTKLTDKLKAAGHRSNSSSERSINSSDQPKEGIVQSNHKNMTKLNDDIKKVELGLASELVETVARQVKEKEEEIAFKMQQTVAGYEQQTLLIRNAHLKNSEKTIMIINELNDQIEHNAARFKRLKMSCLALFKNLDYPNLVRNNRSIVSLLDLMMGHLEFTKEERDGIVTETNESKQAKEKKPLRRTKDKTEAKENNVLKQKKAIKKKAKKEGLSNTNLTKLQFKSHENIKTQ